VNASAHFIALPENKNMRPLRLLGSLVGLLAVGGAAQPTPDLVHLVFAGSFREVCKTAMLSGQVESFPSVVALRQARLVADQTMRSGHPAIKDKSTPRFPEESHLVSVTATLLAFKFESHAAAKSGDNDFHVIIGDSASELASLLNVEVSGLPKAGDPGNKFAAVRQQLLGILTTLGLTPTPSFQRLTRKVVVRVTGALYFDADHLAGSVGPTGLRPTTVWEIHPIQKIEVLGP